MNEGNILVTFGALEEAAADTQQIGAQIAQQLDALHGYLGPLTGSWTGQAASDYQTLQRKWDASAADLHQVLLRIAQSLQTAQDNYRMAESRNSSLWT